MEKSSERREIKIFKEHKYYVSHKSNDNDTARDVKMVTETQKGITSSANQQV